MTAGRDGPDTSARSSDGSEAPVRSSGGLSLLWKVVGLPVRLALVYGLLMAPWPGWEDDYGKLFAKASAWLFESADPERRVRIAHVQPERGSYAHMWKQDTVVSLKIAGASVGDRQVPTFGTARSSRYTGYTPMALTIALVIAMPISWRRRMTALPWAVLLAVGFSALMLAFFIHGWFHVQEWIVLAETSAAYETLARTVGALLGITSGFGPYYIAPVIIAVLATLRRADLESVFELIATRSSRG